jgi:hypothetical protein
MSTIKQYSMKQDPLSKVKLIKGARIAAAKKNIASSEVVGIFKK